MAALPVVEDLDEHAYTISTPLVVFLSGCGGGSGDVAVNIWGEEYIEQGIPTAEFEDGGSASFSKFLISIGDVTLADSEAGAAGDLLVATVFDLAAPGPHEVGVMAELPADTHDDLAYSVVPVSGETAAHVSASAADVEMMAQMGYSIYVEGTVSGAETKSFAWGFSGATRYERCIDVSSGQELSGVVVPDGESTAAQLTIHGDHLFYDDLLSTNAKLRSAMILSADADLDGEVTLEELSAIALADIPPEQGPYGASDANDLGAYMRAATRTLGHFNGEGHCEIRNLP